MESKAILSERIRQRRLQKGYSQEYLADCAQLSIRTLQRIEGGQTEPRGHTLLALANALDIAIEDLMDFTKKSDRSILHLINLSALSYFVLPLGNIILPLIIWILYKDKIEGVNQFGKRQIFIQIGFTMLTFFVIVFSALAALYTDGIVCVNFESWPIFAYTSIFSFYILNAVYIAMVFFLILKDRQVKFIGLRK